jgi:hypothetical protein
VSIAKAFNAIRVSKIVVRASFKEATADVKNFKMFVIAVADEGNKLGCKFAQELRPLFAILRLYKDK